jgi:predicted small lipoprotein YifL
MKNIEKLLIVTLTAMLLLSACGQKGPLYLPESETSEGEDTQDEKDESEDATKE